eukprot:scaffold108190_cov51-Phaeocystis_antarctica.AAC.1
MAGGASAAWLWVGYPLPSYHPCQAARRSRGCAGRRCCGGRRTPATERRRRRHMPPAAARDPLGCRGLVTLPLTL